MNKVFIYHYAGKHPHQVKVYHPATMFKAAGVTTVPCTNTPLKKLKPLLREMYDPCEMFTVEIMADNDDKRTS